MKISTKKVCEQFDALLLKIYLRSESLNQLQILKIIINNPETSNNYNNNMSTQLIKSARNTPTSTLYNEIQYHNKMVTTHMIDGIYQGYVNRSYQRDGFGILQT